MRFSSKVRYTYREFKFTIKGLISTRHPILAHVIPIRRCNLSCAYCNEYDNFSAPVPTDVMRHRIDRLAKFGTAAVVISGGEPLMHPELEVIVRHIRNHGMLTGLISNCYLLTKDRILRLNQAGLEYLQISIDNVLPDDVSMKSLKVLNKRLNLLKEFADFKVDVNSVLGSGVRNPSDALTIAHRAAELGFSSTVGIVHDGLGNLKPLSKEERKIYYQIKAMSKKSYARVNYFQDDTVEGRPSSWRCRAGARYLYICEDGLVHYCSQQRGFPAIPLEHYTREDIRREYLTPKKCATHCTISCVHQVATFDFWRGPQTRAGAAAPQDVIVQPVDQFPEQA